MSNNGKIKILLTEDHKIMREGLISLLDGQPDIKIVGEAEDGEKAMELAGQYLPDIIIVGVNIDGAKGIETIKKLTKRFPSAKIIAHSIYKEKAFISEMLKAGISAYVHKENSVTEFLKAINTVVRNQLYLCPKVTDVMMDCYLQVLSQKTGTTETALSERECEVLKLIADGSSSKKIALKLHIISKTVDTHRRQIMNKLSLYSIPELTKYAIRSGLASLN